MRTKANQGFTLIELSVLLVLAGLILSATLMVQTLLHDAQLKSSVMDMQKYRETVVRFKERHQALPGDFKGAYDLWDERCKPDKEHCNGNGNGWIENTPQLAEGEAIWHHLWLDGLIEVPYRGASPTPIAPRQYPNLTNPEIKLKTRGGEAGMVFAYSSPEDGIIPGKNHIGMGGVSTKLEYPASAVLTPMEAYSIDRKFDDGDYLNGMWQTRDAIPNVSPSCIRDGGLNLINREISCITGVSLDTVETTQEITAE